MSDVQLKTQDLGLKLSVCLQLLAWLYDRAHDSLFMERIVRALGYELENGRIK